MSPKRHLRSRKIFRIIVEQLHPIGMTSCPDVSSVRVNRQVINQSVQLQSLSNTEEKQEIKAIRNPGSKLQHNQQTCPRLSSDITQADFFLRNTFSPLLFFFSPGMHHPHLCAVRNLFAALSFPHQLIHTYTSVDAFSALCSDPHCLRQTSTAAQQHAQGFLPSCWWEGGRPEAL